MPRIAENALLIYTDGSLYPKGRKGGYGVVFVHVDETGRDAVVHEHAPPGIVGTTGNRMELQACLDGLRIAPGIACFRSVAKVVIRTDSRYLADNHLNALHSWRRQRWCNANGRPVDNADLWKEFVRVHAKIRKRVVIEWIKGHGKGRAKDQYNCRADALAKGSAKNPLSQRIFRGSVRRKFTAGVTKAGSVRLLGQMLIIYVIEVQRMRIQKTWKYRYQVVSANSADQYAIDWIYSTEQLRDGHYYEVQVNDDMRHPQLVAVLREIFKDDLDGAGGAPRLQDPNNKALPVPQNNP